MRLLCILCISYGLTVLGEASERRLIVYNIANVYNLVNLNEKEIDSLADIIASYSSKSILSDNNRILMNVSIVPSSHPDNFTIIQTLDAYSKDYIYSILKRYNSSGGNTASFKGILKAIQISVPNSYIKVYTNIKPSAGHHLLHNISDSMTKKRIRVSFHGIEKDSFYDMEHDQLQYAERMYIDVVSRCLDHSLKMEEMMKRNQYESSTTQRTSQAGKPKSFSAFVYDIVNTTENVLIDISNKMKTQFDNAKSSQPFNHHSLVFSSKPETIIKLNTTLDFSTNEFRNLIKSRTRNAPIQKSSLKGLQKMLEISPSNSKIIYFVNSEPVDKYHSLPEIIQLIVDKKIEVAMQPYGSLSGDSLPMVFKTIAKASKRIDDDEFYYKYAE